MSTTQMRTFQPGLMEPATLGELWLHLHTAVDSGRGARAVAAARQDPDAEMLAHLQELLLGDVRDRLTQIILGREQPCPASCDNGVIEPLTDVIEPPSDCSTCRGRGYIRVDGLEARITRVMADLNVELPSITERLSAAIVAETVEIDPMTDTEGRAI